VTSPTEERSVCIANIGPLQRRRRFQLGVGSLLAGGALALGAAIADAGPLAVAVATVLVFGGFTGLFQARANTCVRLAAGGLRNMDSGPERLLDPAELSLVRKQAVRVTLQALAATVAFLSVLLLLLP